MVSHCVPSFDITSLLVMITETWNLHPNFQYTCWITAVYLSKSLHCCNNTQMTQYVPAPYHCHLNYNCIFWWWQAGWEKSEPSMHFKFIVGIPLKCMKVDLAFLMTHSTRVLQCTSSHTSWIILHSPERLLLIPVGHRRSSTVKRAHSWVELAQLAGRMNNVISAVHNLVLKKKYMWKVSSYSAC